MKLSRRRLLQASAAGALAGPRLAWAEAPKSGIPESGTPKSVVLISASHLRADLLDDGGAAFGAELPNLRRLLAEGRRFSRSYAAEPLPHAAQAAWLTGRVSAEHGALLGDRPLRPELPLLGSWVREQAGVDAAWVGRARVTGSDGGFELLHAGHALGAQGDLATAQAAAGWISRRERGQPSLLHVAFAGPSDIYDWLARLQAAGRYDAGVPIDDMPALPQLQVPEGEPQGLKPILRRGPFGADDVALWRALRWAYARLCESLDAALGVVLDAIDASPLRERTALLFTADHGVMLGEQLLFGRGAPYEPSLRAPLILRDPHGAGAGEVDARLVSGLDVPATVCALLGAPPLPGSAGLSVLGGLKREALVLPYLIQGRAALTADRSYLTWRGEDGGLLYDLAADPKQRAPLPQGREHRRERKALDRLIAEWERGLSPVDDWARSWESLITERDGG